MISEEALETARCMKESLDTRKIIEPQKQSILMEDKVLEKIEKVGDTYIFETYEKPLRQQIEDLKQANKQLNEARYNSDLELQQLYSHLGVEAFGEDIQEQAVKEIDRLVEENKQLKEQLAIRDRMIMLILKNTYYIDKEYFIEEIPTQDEYIISQKKYWLKQAKESMK